MTITLGIDSLCWHMRLEAAAVTIEQVVDDAASLGAGVVAVNLHHVRDRDPSSLVELAARAAEHGIAPAGLGRLRGLTAPRRHPSRRRGAHRALVGGSGGAGQPDPAARLGLLSGRPRGPARADRGGARSTSPRCCARASAPASAEGVRLILENHSDFTIDEYERIVHEVGEDHVGVFLDLINPIMTFDDPVPRDRDARAPRAERARPGLRARSPSSSPTDTTGAVSTCDTAIPARGSAPIPELVAALNATVGDRPYDLLIEGLDSQADVDDQHDGWSPRRRPFDRCCMRRR